jgi:hypothetical protein
MSPFVNNRRHVPVKNIKNEIVKVVSKAFKTMKVKENIKK